MKKTYMVLGIMFMFMLTAVSAAEQQIYSSFVFSDESITADGKTFIIRLNQYATSSLVQFDQYYLSIPVRQCQTESVYRVCFNRTEYDTTQKKYKGLFRIFSLKPAITITRTVDNRNPVMGEEAIISVTLENTGGKKAYNIQYEDDFPDSVEFTRKRRVTSDGSIIRWEGNLDIGDTEEMSYTFKSSEAFERSLKAKVTFFDGDEEKEIYSSAVNLDVKPALEVKGKFEDEDYFVPHTGINFNLKEDEIFVGNELILVINAQNNRIDNESIEPKIIFTFPETLEFLRADTIKVYTNSTSYYNTGGVRLVKISDRQYRWDGKVVSDRLMVLRFRGKLVGDATVSADITYDFKGDEITETELFSIDVINQPLFISTTLKDNEELDSAQAKTIRVWVQNPNDDVEFRDIKVWFNTTLFNQPPFYIDTLRKSTSSKVLEKTFQTPITTKDLNTHFNVHADYTTAFGEKFTELLERDIKIKAIKGITITHSFSPSTVESGEEADVKVTVKNERAIDIPSVHVRDAVPKEFSVIGTNDRFVDINKKDSLNVYTYKVIAPLVKNQTKYDIETFVDYRESGIYYNYSKKGTITVKPKELKLTVSRTFSTTELSKGEIFDISYRISNPEDELLKDIVIYFPVQYDFDLIGKKTYSIKKLDPGESATLNNVARLMPKLNETRKLNKSYVWYESGIGARYNVSVSDQSFSKIKDGKISIPSVLVRKLVNKPGSVGESVPVVLEFRNVGNKEAELNVSDGGQEWKLKVCQGCTRTLTYTIEKDKAGNFTLAPAIVTITNHVEPVTTASNKAKLEIKSEEAVETVMVTPEENIVEEEIEPEAEEEEPEEEVVEAEPRGRFPVELVAGIIVAGLLIIIGPRIFKALKKPKEKEEEKEEKEEKKEEEPEKEEKAGEKAKKGKGQVEKVASELERIAGEHKKKGR